MTTITLNPALTGQYQLDPIHSRLGFVARHVMVTKVHGAFATFEATACLDADTPSSSTVRVSIDVASVETGNQMRDEHLRSNDFLDAAAFPQITFVSTAVDHIGAGTFQVTGDLTIKGVTRPVTIDLEYNGSAVDAQGAERVGFEGKAVINRTDFGVSFNAVLETGGVMISEKITLEFDISAVKVALVS
ncbi:YceI family protein [Streptosporangium subroseum]|uniref:YceI family protein n=1 Tax=Streptosporangium subroseum TaxID=106412 RepID=UPI00342027B9